MVSDKKTNEKRFRDAVVAVAAIAFLYLVFHLTGVGCPVKYITGISCPGCGMTRAWKAVLKWHSFGAAFEYHPLWFLPIPGAALLIFQKHIPKKAFRVSIILIAVCFAVVYGVRMADPNDTVVTAAPGDGLIGRAIRWIAGRF
ncbi:MAG: DUF2752 domain-containing protein [Lachnospiraceae bacterium]|nr:DUF2752 domain-containing protein [Lachnospiraceae bacterium]